MSLTTPSKMRTACRILWGSPDKTISLAPGVKAYSTPGHGGIIVSTELFPLDERLRKGLFNAPIQWTYPSTGQVALEMVGFEEDCDVLALMYCHPELLEPAVRKGYFGAVATPEYIAERIGRDDYYAAIR